MFRLVLLYLPAHRTGRNVPTEDLNVKEVAEVDPQNTAQNDGQFVFSFGGTREAVCMCFFLSYVTNPVPFQPLPVALLESH